MCIVHCSDKSLLQLVSGVNTALENKAKLCTLRTILIRSIMLVAQCEPCLSKLISVNTVPKQE